MKHLAQFGTIIIIFFMLSCKKDISSKTLAGKWNIRSDSSYAGVGLGNHVVNYFGQTGDYFDFKPNGTLSIKENGRLDILNYVVTSDSTVNIDSFYNGTSAVFETCEITNLTVHNVIISTPILLTPGGIFGRKVYLIR